MVDDEVEVDFYEILNHQSPTTNHQLPKINQRVSKEKYIEKVSKMLDHIDRGDIYEANFCMEFFAKDAEINPSQVYESDFISFITNFCKYILNPYSYTSFRCTCSYICSWCQFISNLCPLGFL